MAQDIQTPNVGSLLSEFFRLVGTVRPQLEEMVLPTVSIGDLSGSSPPVRRRHASAQGAQVAAAGQNAFFELAMLDPNTLAVVTDIYASSSSATDGLFVASSSGIVTGAGITTHTARYTDQRVRGSAAPGYLFRSQSLAGGPIANNLVQMRFPLTTALLHIKPEGLVLLGAAAPSLAGGLTICQEDVAETLLMTIEWDEYQLP
jgi:hypothetical protein